MNHEYGLHNHLDFTPGVRMFSLTFDKSKRRSWLRKLGKSGTF